jgi:hypothetical protein
MVGTYTIKPLPVRLTRWEYLSIMLTNGKGWEQTLNSLRNLLLVFIPIVIIVSENPVGGFLFSLIAFPIVFGMASMFFGALSYVSSVAYLFQPLTYEITDQSIAIYPKKKYKATKDRLVPIDHVHSARITKDEYLVLRLKDGNLYILPVSTFKNTGDGLRTLLSWLEYDGATIIDQREQGYR